MPPSPEDHTKERILRRTLLQALAWGALMALAVYASLQVTIAAKTSHLGALLLIYFAGGALAFPPAIAMAQRISRGKRAEARFSAAFLCLGGLTLMATAVLMALVYRLFLAPWHAETGFGPMLFDFLFGIASALYQFAVLGIRNLIPLGLVFLVIASLWLARATR
jgi:hypothetical protein